MSGRCNFFNLIGDIVGGAFEFLGIAPKVPKLPALPNPEVPDENDPALQKKLLDEKRRRSAGIGRDDLIQGGGWSSVFAPLSDKNGGGL